MQSLWYPIVLDVLILCNVVPYKSVPGSVPSGCRTWWINGCAVRSKSNTMMLCRIIAFESSISFCRVTLSLILLIQTLAWNVAGQVVNFRWTDTQSVKTQPSNWNSRACVHELGIWGVIALRVHFNTLNFAELKDSNELDCINQLQFCGGWNVPSLV